MTNTERNRDTLRRLWVRLRIVRDVPNAVAANQRLHDLLFDRIRRQEHQHGV
jgi:hypothetical protein